ncbi:hypothetical protein L596_004633 [Steinernema carpocapsae]|nr:hypothetical protein L596_004633 [Steinernema carpocapsae]
MCTVAFSVTFSVMILNFHQRSPKTHAMSDWMRILFLHWLPWLLMMRRPGFILKKNEPFQPETSYEFHEKPRLPPREPLNNLKLLDTMSEGRLVKLLLLENTLNYLVKVNDQLNEEYGEAKIEREWKYAAFVLDRLSMFTTTIFITTVSISLFLSTF